MKTHHSRTHTLDTMDIDVHDTVCLQPLLSSNHSTMRSRRATRHSIAVNDAEHPRDHCFTSTLHALTNRPSGCMRRTNLARGDVHQSFYLPIYATVVPVRLRERMEALERRLAALGSPSVTFIECANREDVAALSAEERMCVHPRYFRMDLRGIPEELSNGTLSLSLKHALAYFDVVHRDLPAALVLEDDAMVPASLWRQLAAYHVPCDASIFWLSAYRNNMGTFSLAGAAFRPVQPSAEAVHIPDGPTIYRRLENNSEYPVIISAAGYIIFARGARLMMTHPVYAPADVAISCLTPQCMGSGPKATFELRAPSGQYGPGRWFFGQNQNISGGTHLLSI